MKIKLSENAKWAIVIILGLPAAMWAAVNVWQFVSARLHSDLHAEGSFERFELPRGIREYPKRVREQISTDDTAFFGQLAMAFYVSRSTTGRSLAEVRNALKVFDIGYDPVRGGSDTVPLVIRKAWAATIHGKVGDWRLDLLGPSPIDLNGLLRLRVRNTAGHALDGVVLSVENGQEFKVQRPNGRVIIDTNLVETLPIGTLLAADEVDVLAWTDTRYESRWWTPRVTLVHEAGVGTVSVKGPGGRPEPLFGWTYLIIAWIVASSLTLVLQQMIKSTVKHEMEAMRTPPTETKEEADGAAADPPLSPSH